jgi:hypothetical protein
MIWFAFLVSLGIGFGSLAWSYLQVDHEYIALFLSLYGALWILAKWKNWNWFSTGGIFLTLGFAAYGLWIDLSTGWMLAGALGGLMAWDLADFMSRMRSAPKSENMDNLQKRHLARLTIVAVLGLVLASIAMAVRMEFTFEWLAVLALVAILGISQVVTWLRKGGN